MISHLRDQGIVMHNPTILKILIEGIKNNVKWIE